MQRLVPIILCGGAGRRLWPLSTPERPKPFLAFDDGDSLFQQTLRRVSDPLFVARPIVVAHRHHAGLAREQAQAIGAGIVLVLEPEGRDTCAAALAGLLVAAQQQPGSCAALLAADHAIPDPQAFARTLALALPAAEAGSLTTFGIRPRGPSPELGYLVPGEKLVHPCVYRVQAFAEKPDAGRATALIAQGARWNSGNFVGATQTWLTEAARLAPQTLVAVQEALPPVGSSSDTIPLGENFFAAPAISLDRAIMERSDKVAMVMAEHDWSDLGTWDEVARHLGGPNGNFILADAGEVIVSGLDDLIVVVSGGRILVTRRGQSADLKEKLMPSPPRFTSA